MARLGRSQPIQTRPLAIPQLPPGSGQGSVTATAALSASGSKQASGSALFSASAILAATGTKQASGSAALSATATGIAGPPPAVHLTGLWANAITAPVQPTGIPAPANASVSVETGTTAGSWLFAVVAWRQPPGYPPVTFSVGDNAVGGTNWWDPMGAPTGTTDSRGVVRTAVWRAPAARPAALVTAAPTGFALSAALMVLQFTGPEPWLIEATTAGAYGNGVSSLPAFTPPAASGAVLWLAVLARDLNTAQVVLTAPGAPPGGPPVGGWNLIEQASVSNGFDHTSDLTLSAAWLESETPVTAAWAATHACDMAGLVTGILVTAPSPAQGNPAWPVTTLEMAPGAGALTPPDELSWVEIDDALIARYQDLGFTAGQQYELGTTQAGRGAVTHGNPDLALMPPGSGQYSGIDSGTPVRLRMSWPGGGAYPQNPAPHYVPFSGFYERWPQSASASRRQVSQATILDAWAYCQAQLRSGLQHEVLADFPTFYWPLGDLAGVTYAANIAAGPGSALAMITSRYGAGPATAAFGGSAGLLPGVPGKQVSITSAGLLPGDSGTAWTQTGMPAALAATGWLLYCQDPGLPALTGPASVDGWYQLTDAQIYSDAILWTVKAATGPIMALTVRAIDGALVLTSWDPAGTPTATVVDSTRTYLAGPVFHTALTWTPAAGWLCYVDGTEAAGSGSAPAVLPQIAWISAGGEGDRFSSGGCWDGAAAHLAVYPLALPPSRVAAHYQAGATGLETEEVSSRIERLLGYAGWTGRRVIEPPPSGSPGDQAASMSDIATQQAGSAMSNVVSSVPPAMLTVAPAGHISYHPKSRSFGEPVTWKLGDRTDLGEIPVLPDIAWDYDPTRVLDDIQVTQLDRQDVITPQVAPLEARSAGQYGTQTSQVTGYLYGDLTTPLTSPEPAGLIDLANWLALTNAAPSLRVTTVTIDAARYPIAWPLVLGARPGDLAQVVQRPVTAQPQLAGVARITRVARKFSFQMDGPTGQVQLTLDACPEARPLTLDDPDKGQLNGTSVLTW